MDGSTFGGSLIRLDHREASSNYDDSDITARLATTPEVLAEAWSVRHAAYLSQGFIERSEDGLFKDECDAFPSTKTVVVYKNYVPVATVRVCLYAPGSGIEGADTIPALDVFQDDIFSIFRQYRDSNRQARGAEVMRLSRHPDLGSDFEPVFALFRMVGYLLLHFQADVVISAVRKHHTSFYRRMGFRRMTEPRPYPKLNVETALMACIRGRDQSLRECLPVLGLISQEDSNYADFLAGERVPVFGTCQAPIALNGNFGARFEGTRAPLPSRAYVHPQAMHPAM